MPELVIPDNEKAAVREASRYEPDLNPTYQELATHYGTTVLPARPRAPRDKAKAEAAVQHVERWVMAPLRNQTFFSLGELREAIAPLLAALNERPFEKTDGSRRSWFEDLDRPALKAASGPALRVRPVAQGAGQHRLPHPGRARALQRPPPAGPLRGRRSAHGPDRGDLPQAPPGRRALRIHRRGGYATERSHMPASHRAHAGWTPSRLIAWGQRTGSHTAAFVEQLLDSRPHPEQGYRSCLGLKELLRAYGAERPWRPPAAAHSTSAR